jgi:hypothetical protein
LDWDKNNKEQQVSALNQNDEVWMRMTWNNIFRASFMWLRSVVTKFVIFPSKLALAFFPLAAAFFFFSGFGFGAHTQSMLENELSDYRAYVGRHVRLSGIGMIQRTTLAKWLPTDRNESVPLVRNGRDHGRGTEE